VVVGGTATEIFALIMWTSAFGCVADDTSDWIKLR
jgi:hypothetical protein